jgi:hypothetical protein
VPLPGHRVAFLSAILLPLSDMTATVGSGKKAKTCTLAKYAVREGVKLKIKDSQVCSDVTPSVCVLCISSVSSVCKQALIKQVCCDHLA